MQVSLGMKIGFAMLIAAVLVRAQGATLTPDEQNTVTVYRQASRGVVYIMARTTVGSPLDQRPSDAASISNGTGFVIDNEGRILTAYHIIEDRDEITVALGTRQAIARVVGTAPQLDIALLQIEVPKDELFPLALGTSQDLAVGQKVMAIGNAAGLNNSLTVGVVSAVKRSLDGAAVELEDSFIQTDAAINPGNSGGPLLNSMGQAVGINDAILKNAQNMGFAIPIDLAKSVLPDLIEMGHPYKPMLGFSGSEVTSSTAELFGLPVKRGFLIEEVLPGSRIVTISDRPFVLGGDIIVAVNGEPFASAAKLAQDSPAWTTGATPTPRSVSPRQNDRS